MGLFSRSRTITVSASTMNLVSVSKKPFVDTVIEAVVRQRNVTESLLTTMHNGIAVNIPRMYAYARDTYTLGLPQGNALNYSDIDLNRIDEILLIEQGNVPLLRTVGAAYLNITPAIAVYPHLYSNRGYDRLTNKISVYPPGLIWQQSVEPGSINVATANKEVRVKSASVALDGVSIDIVYGLFVEHPFLVTVDEYTTAIENKYVEESYTYTENTPLIGAPGISWGEDYLVAFYKEYEIDEVTPSSGEIPWLYQVSSNVYVDLKPLDIATPVVDYLPVIPLRYENKDLMADEYKTTDLYLTSQRIAKITKLDLDVLAGKLNANPNVASIDHAYVMYGINLQTETSASLLYLHKFFEQLYNLQYTDQLEYLDKLGTVPYYGLSAINSYSPGLTDPSLAFDEYGLNVFLDYDYILSTIEAGQVGTGKIGNVSKEFVEYTEDYIIPGSPWGESPLPDTIEQVTKGALILNLQIETNIIHKITVKGLEHRNLIYEGHAEHTSMLDVIRNPDENNLVIPIQFQLAQSLKFLQRSDLYLDSLILVINTYDVVVGDWYSADWFKIIIIIVAVVIIVLTIVYAPWAVWAELEGFALLWAVLTYVATQVLISVVVSLAAKFLIRQFGAQFGIIGTMILLVIAVVASRGYGSSEAAKQFALWTAQTCLQAGAALIGATNEFLIEAGQKIINEYVDFSNKLEDKYEELKTTQDLLANMNDVDPLTFVKPPRLKILPNESPTQFYSRCLELPAYTMFTIHDQISNFASLHLTLPKALPNNMYITSV